MATTINGTTGVSLVQDGVVSQADLGVNVAGNGPCFSAYQATPVAVVSATPTKVLFQTKEFDTATAFDAVTNSRFQPQTPGYYQVSGLVNMDFASTTLYSVVYKNGASHKRGQQSGTAAASAYSSSFSVLMYLNGSTDYVEIYIIQNSGGALNTVANPSTTYFQGYLARSA